jgi:pyruvate formate-lyase activating enzyme-like uncharacterized protein
MDFCHHEADVLEEISRLQEGITELRDHHCYQANSAGALIPGCAICTRMTHLTLQMGFRCNASCPFCFLDTYWEAESRPLEDNHRQMVLRDFQARWEEIEGIAISGGEPLLYLEELETYVRRIRQIKPDIYLWLYTNGILADKNNLVRVQSLGINEIRFNLAASNYDSHIIEHISLARPLFPSLAVEIPSYPVQKELLLAVLDELDHIGIDQLNLQELLLTPKNMKKVQGEGYEAGFLCFQKYFLYGSRKMTYEIMRYCLDHRYSFTINDCSARMFGKKP